MDAVDPVLRRAQLSFGYEDLAAHAGRIEDFVLLDVPVVEALADRVQRVGIARLAFLQCRRQALLCRDVAGRADQANGPAVVVALRHADLPRPAPGTVAVAIAVFADQPRRLALEVGDVLGVVAAMSSGWTRARQSSGVPSSSWVLPNSARMRGEKNTVSSTRFQS